MITDERVNQACLAYGGGAFPASMRRALRAVEAEYPDAGTCLYVASLLRDLRNEMSSVDEEDSEADAIDEVAEFLQRLGSR